MHLARSVSPVVSSLHPPLACSLVCSLSPLHAEFPKGTLLLGISPSARLQPLRRRLSASFRAARPLLSMTTSSHTKGGLKSKPVRNTVLLGQEFGFLIAQYILAAVVSYCSTFLLQVLTT